jgi:inosose dehydratase
MKTMPIDEALKTCASIGYRNVEFALNPGYPTEPSVLSSDARKSIRREIESLKLELSAFMLNMSLAADDKAHAQSLEAIAAAAQLAHELVPAAPPVIETVLGGKPKEWDNIKERMAARLRDWAEAASREKVTIAIKAHVASAVNSPDRLLWLLQKADSPAIKVTYDYSHFELQGIPLEDSLKALLPHTRFIHVKDTAGDDEKFQFLLPGEGRTDYVTYFKLLRKYRYEGPVVVEVSAQVFNKPDYDPVAAARKCHAVLHAAMEKAGGVGAAR